MADSYEEKFDKLLSENTTDRFHIEYGGYKTNHMSQSLYALKKLNAPLADAEKFITWIRHKLEDAEVHRGAERSKPKPNDRYEVLGTGKAYYYLKDEYTKLYETTYGKSVKELVASQYMRLSDGILGAATHGLIHLGYGLASKHSWFALEGLAYLHDFYSAPTYKKTWDPRNLGSGDHDILDVVELVRNDTELLEVMYTTARSKEYVDKYSLDFWRKQWALYDKRADKLAEYVQMIRFPPGLSGADLTKERVVDLADWIINSAVAVYALSEKKNDFFLLHGVTSSWALKNVLPVLGSCDNVLASSQSFLIMLLTVYLIQGHPPIAKTLPDAEPPYTWEQLVEKAIADESDEHEHMSKLVQVCRDMSQENSDPGKEKLYKLACQCCLDYPFVFE